MLRSLKQKKIKIILLNARISKKSFQRWKHLKKLGVDIFSNFDFIFPQNKETFNYLKFFNVKKIQILGNLKFCEAKKINSSKVIYNNFFSRKILCAASTHNNEEEIISNIHLNLKKKINNLLKVIIPRHAERTKEILNMLKYKKLNYICHSENKSLTKDTDIYLVDTYGESKKFYAISKVVFLGGSLVPKGGQNPLEPVRYGCNVIHGKHTFNFTEIYKMLSKEKLSYEAKNLLKLNKLIFSLLLKKQNNKKKVKKFNNIGKDILKKNFKEIRLLI